MSAIVPCVPINIYLNALITLNIQCEEVIISNKIVFERNNGVHIMNPGGTSLKRILASINRYSHVSRLVN